MEYPRIIQGGMAAGISNWRLAREVSLTGNLGVVAGTALDVILARRLQDGDHDGKVREALACFPDRHVAEEILSTYYVEGGVSVKHSYRQVPLYRVDPSHEHIRLSVAAAFVEVFLAKQGHPGQVGINLLEKIQLPNPYFLYGAMLAGVDYIIMGAGIPVQIPGVLDSLAENKPISLCMSVRNGEKMESYPVGFDPSELFPECARTAIRRPGFFPIVSSNVLALTMVKKSSGEINGLIIEHHTAGGHNAPPRGKYQLSETGEPIYGSKDEVDLEGIKKLDVPYYLAGGYGNPEKFNEALSLGAAGIQVGTPFEFCRESGLDPELKTTILEQIRDGITKVFTDPLASPTGFPFKVLDALGSLSDRFQYGMRQRICDLGYLRTLFRKQDGSIGYRCPAEPEELYVRKGGLLEETVDRKCLCNALLSNMGLPRLQLSGYLEKPLVTAGDCLKTVKALIAGGELSYTARDVVDFILSGRSGLGGQRG